MSENNKATQRIAWIETIPVDEAKPPLSDMYARERDPLTRKVDHILMVHSLHAQTLDDHARMYHTLMHGDGTLTRVEREMIAVVVSTINECHY